MAFSNQPCAAVQCPRGVRWHGRTPVPQSFPASSCGSSQAIAMNTPLESVEQHCHCLHQRCHCTHEHCHSVAVPVAAPLPRGHTACAATTVGNGIIGPGCCCTAACCIGTACCIAQGMGIGCSCTAACCCGMGSSCCCGLGACSSLSIAAWCSAIACCCRAFCCCASADYCFCHWAIASSKSYPCACLGPSGTAGCCCSGGGGP